MHAATVASEREREREKETLLNEIDYLFEMRKINVGMSLPVVNYPTLTTISRFKQSQSKYIVCTFI